MGDGSSAIKQLALVWNRFQFFENPCRYVSQIAGRNQKCSVRRIPLCFGPVSVAESGKRAAEGYK
jgi:hypothetical protein